MSDFAKIPAVLAAVTLAAAAAYYLPTWILGVAALTLLGYAIWRSRSSSLA